MKSYKQKQAFTLIELIAVIGIIALLSVLSIPAYNSINRSANMRLALSEVESATYLARQQSITLRQRVGFGIPIQILDPANNYVKSNMLHRSFIMFTQEAGGAAKRQKILGKVGQLPKGIYFTSDSLSGLTMDFSDSSGNKVVKVNFFRYAPLGTVYFQDLNDAKGADFKIILGEGTVGDDGTPKSTSDQTRTNRISSYTGRCIPVN